jgi:hypothetical protein
MSREHVESKLSQELQSFNSIWQGGYFEGDPLDPMGKSSYHELGYMSVLHATYLTCIKPYITGETIACELGPGRGAWTRCLLPAKEIWCLDALSADHNKFWDYIKPTPHIKYHQVSDFSCEMLRDDSIDYLFSFGCLCHVSFEGIKAYMTSLHRKLRSGSHAFIMVADYEKYNSAIRRIDSLSLVRSLPRLLRPAIRVWLGLRRSGAPKLKDPDPDDIPNPGRWYDAGLERTCRMLRDLSYRIVDPDVGVNHRDPIIHFAKD